MRPTSSDAERPPVDCYSRKAVAERSRPSPIPICCSGGSCFADPASGTAVACCLSAGFAVVRKPGKLPWKKVSATYDLEYGTDTLEMHEDAIVKGQRVLVVDDVLATGGTMKACCDIVQHLGGQLAGIAVVIELEALNGRSKLGGRPSKSLW